MATSTQDSFGEAPLKKPKHNFESPGEFTEDDEVMFTFPKNTTTNNRLFFSKVIITRCSPVIKAYFEHDCIERRKKEVVIEDIDMADFIQFLKFCDPLLVELPTDQNVIQMVEIAEKYQNESMIRHCRKILSDSVLKKEFQEAIRVSSNSCTSQYPEKILAVLLLAVKFDYEELLQEGADYLMCFDVRQLLNKESFEQLPLDLKYRILSQRVIKVYKDPGFRLITNIYNKYTCTHPVRFVRDLPISVSR